MKKIILGLAALLLLTAPAAAQQSIRIDKATIGGLVYDSTAGNIAGGCQAVSGTFPKQTITGASVVDARTTTSEALADSDRCKLVTFSNGSAVAATIAQAGGGGNFASGWLAHLVNLGAGTVTLTPTTSTINGASTLTLTTGQGADIYSNGTNYFAQGGSAAGAGTVNSVTDGSTTVASPTQVNFTSGCTVSSPGGGVAGVACSGGGSSTPVPQGRLTLVSDTPVMSSDQTAKSQIYYDCYAGKQVPYYTGSADAADSIGSCEVSTTMQTSSTGVTNSGGVFDVWWAHAHTGICVATNGSGGGWASDTGGSNTARGTGYSQVHNTRGYWTNVNSIAHCYNGATDWGSLSADQATYLGSVYTTAAGQTGMAVTPAAANGGTANILGVFNAYNRVPIRAICRDNTASWNYSTVTWRASDNSASNSISWVDGLQQSSVDGQFSDMTSGTSTGGAVGVNLDATTGTPGTASQNNTNNGSSSTARMTFQPQLGFHFIQAMEIPLNTNTTTWYGLTTSPAAQIHQLTVELMM